MEPGQDRVERRQRPGVAVRISTGDVRTPSLATPTVPANLIMAPSSSSSAAATSVQVGLYLSSH